MNSQSEQRGSSNGGQPTNWSRSLDLGIYYKPLQVMPDEEDRIVQRANCAVDIFNRHMHELLPILGFTGCLVEQISEEMTVVTAPLIESAMNQNGTHQAGIFYLLADCALAVGIFGALPGTYIAGIHDRCHGLPVQFWTKQGAVQHIAPGTGEIRAVVQIVPEKRAELRAALISKGRTDCRETIHIYQGEQLVAKAEMTLGVYADLPRTPGARTNALQAQNLKLSALLIAGLRADPLSQMIAQEQGRAMAERMTAATPQLPSLVQARTTHIEGYLRQEGRDHKQVVVLGIGLDIKALRFAHPDQHWYGLDLPSMIKERSKLLEQAGIASDYVTLVSSDVRAEDWVENLCAAGYDKDRSTLFILEGVSMYLSLGELQTLLCQVCSATINGSTRVWIDHVTPDLFDSELVEVAAFLQTMTRLGEPFILGFKDASSVGEPRWQLDAAVSAADFLHIVEPVHNMYRFSLLRPAAL